MPRKGVRGDPAPHFQCSPARRGARARAPRAKRPPDAPRSAPPPPHYSSSSAPVGMVSVSSPSMSVSLRPMR